MCAVSATYFWILDAALTRLREWSRKGDFCGSGCELRRQMFFVCVCVLKLSGSLTRRNFVKIKKFSYSYLFVGPVAFWNLLVIGFLKQMTVGII